MNEMIKAERNKICSRKQTRMLFLAGVVLIVAYFFFFQFNYQNVFYDYDLEKMALASGFTAIEQRKEVAEIFEGKLSQNTLLTMQEKIDQAKQATVGQAFLSGAFSRLSFRQLFSLPFSLLLSFLCVPAVPQRILPIPQNKLPFRRH